MPVAVIAAVVMLTSPLQARQAAPSVETLLARATAYLVDFAKSYAQVVAEEHYHQSLRPKRVSVGLTTTTPREITSDVVAVSDSDQTWLNFRDVFAVDNVSIRDRDERLTKLFLNTTVDPLAQARVIANEGARFNLGHVSRNVNFPAMALTFLAGANQPRSSFKLDGRAKVAGVETMIVAFKETRIPTVVKSGADNLPVSGRFWIEPASGRVMKSKMEFESRDFSGEVEVTYGYVEKLQLWLPVEMNDSVQGIGEEVVSRATYTNFRKFATSSVIK